MKNTYEVYVDGFWEKTDQKTYSLETAESLAHECKHQNPVCDAEEVEVTIYRNGKFLKEIE